MGIPDPDDERYGELYAAALEWANAREAAQAVYPFFRHEATKTAAKQMADALTAIEDQKWTAVLIAAEKLNITVAQEDTADE